MHPTYSLEPFSWVQPKQAETCGQALDFVTQQGAYVYHEPDSCSNSPLLSWDRTQLCSTPQKYLKGMSDPDSMRDGSPFLPLGLGCQDMKAYKGWAYLTQRLTIRNASISESSWLLTSRPLHTCSPMGQCTKFVLNEKLLKGYLQTTYKVYV